MDIYVQKNDQQLGPFDEACVRSGLESGEFAPSDLAWSRGQNQWKPLQELLTETGGSTEDTNRNATAGFGMEHGGDSGVARTVQHLKSTVSVFKSLDYGFLLPFRKLFGQGLLHKKAVRWVLIFGLFPPLRMVGTVTIVVGVGDQLPAFGTADDVVDSWLRSVLHGGEMWLIPHRVEPVVLGCDSHHSEELTRHLAVLLAWSIRGEDAHEASFHLVELRHVVAAEAGGSASGVPLDGQELGTVFTVPSLNHDHHALLTIR